ncbi:MAG: UDP-2,4-diacetamido-2,4,6-trideoxy-beta-L-altropyranose hydrolase, partial [Gammaproteobacteria bacterium]|nr:UDP-2,4-diacetamido-2,4,6-trideoxy-beta-L-altropyranose hydrolase [Gammaproteobacteria bacterium]NIO61280.1 UDP-2,4-diacetamido-2,4,6-trideoxy-beta-L-altropyranose hydrolase [Gammaproteobacteria bacterium]
MAIEPDNQPRIAVFRADASETIGGGHVIRSMVLAEKLQKADWKCLFASRSSTAAIIADLNTLPLIEIKGELSTEASQLINALPEGIDWLVVDHYQWDRTLEDECRPWAGKIMAIDDLADRNHQVDLLLDQTLSRETGDYQHLVPDACEMLLGPEYALLREQFSGYRNSSLKRRLAGDYRLERVLISFGMTDAGDMTSIALEGIRQSGLKLTIDIVPGILTPNLERIKRIADSLDCSIHFHDGNTDMAKVMHQADLAIGAGGTTSWERCCLGIPSIVVIVADNQTRIADALQAHGAAMILGDRNTVDAGMFSD